MTMYCALCIAMWYWIGSGKSPKSGPLLQEMIGWPRFGHSESEFDQSSQTPTALSISVHLDERHEIEFKGEVKQFFFIGSKFLSAPN